MNNIIKLLGEDGLTGSTLLSSFLVLGLELFLFLNWSSTYVVSTPPLLLWNFQKNCSQSFSQFCCVVFHLG